MLMVELKIPKIIHQIWIGSKKRPEKWMQSCKDMNPTWEYRLWTEKELADEEFKNQNKINEMPLVHGKSDIIRYELLHKYGGFFIDADSEAIKALDDSLLNNDSFTCFESEIHRRGLLANGYLAASKENELMGYLIEEIPKLNLRNRTQAWDVTGPVLLTRMIQQKKYNKIKIFPSEYFIPFHYSDFRVNKSRLKNSYFIQYWGTTRNLY